MTLAGELRDDFHCTVVRRGDELLGFVTTLRDSDTAIACRSRFVLIHGLML